MRGRWSRARRPGDPQTFAPWRRLQAQDRQPAVPWQPGQPCEQASIQPWSAVPAQDAAGAAPWDRAHTASAAPAASPWGAVPARDAANALRWDRSIRPRDTLRLSIQADGRELARGERLAFSFEIDLDAP